MAGASSSSRSRHTTNNSNNNNNNNSSRPPTAAVTTATTAVVAAGGGGERPVRGEGRAWRHGLRLRVGQRREQRRLAKAAAAAARGPLPALARPRVMRREPRTGARDRLRGFGLGGLYLYAQGDAHVHTVLGASERRGKAGRVVVHLGTCVHIDRVRVCGSGGCKNKPHTQKVRPRPNESKQQIRSRANPLLVETR